MTHLPRNAARLTMIVAGSVLLGGSGVAAAASELRPPAAGGGGGATARPPVVVPAPNRYSSTPRPVHGAAPDTIRIPAIGVEAPVEAVGVTSDYAMATPARTSDVGWYSLGSAPGDPGDAVVDGHLDTPAGTPGVFARLAAMTTADAITIVAGGREFHYSVTSVRTVPYAWRPDGLYSVDGPPRLTLITCAGSWDANKGIYRERLVVEASQTTN